MRPHSYISRHDADLRFVQVFKNSVSNPNFQHECCALFRLLQFDMKL